MHTRLASVLIEQQAAEIARDNKQFTQVVALPWYAKWVGTLAPIFQEYLVSISYAPGACDCKFDYPGPRLNVEVLDPELMARRDPPEPIPHLYRHPSLTETPLLCLFWPKEREWDEFKSISEYVIPWTSEWLANYELWRVTGRWPSPEAPHDVGAELKEDASAAPSTEDVPDRRPAARRGLQFFTETALPNLPYFALSGGI